MIQILGLRDYTDDKGRSKKAERFFERKWRAENVSSLFQNLDSLLSTIPESEHYNLYYTVASCLEESGRKFEQQNVIPFDIDNINVDMVSEYISPVLMALGGLEFGKTGIVFSGNGLQFLVQTSTLITDVSYFESARPYYKFVCGRIDSAIKKAGLSGQADPSVWSPARLMRLPNTENRKTDKPIRKAYLIQPILEAVNYDLAVEASAIVVNPDDQVSMVAMRRMPPPDTKGVVNGCAYLQWCRLNQSSVTEPQWYAMLSVVSRLENGLELCHDYSREHPQYSPDETDIKVEQATSSSGPRTCANITSLWDGCKTCSYYGKVHSPISIKSESYIKSKDTGFREIRINANGEPKPLKPIYEDLRKYFEQSYPYITIDSAKLSYIYDDGVWSEYSKQRMESFANTNIVPSPSKSEREEFSSLIHCTNLVPSRAFETFGLLNFKNGVLDIETGEMFPHSKDFMFRSKLPYEFDPSAKCPRFEQYLKEVTNDDSDLEAMLVEFVGFCISNSDPSLVDRVLILHGDGANGKSVLLDVLRTLVGKDNYSSINMANLQKETSRYLLLGKMFNLSEETPSKALLESSEFKLLSAGGEMEVRQLYGQPFSAKNTAKFIFACNDLPYSGDSSYGFYRRMLIAPFNVTFTDAKRDVKLRDKLYAESAGILNLLLDGYRKLKSNGYKFTVCERANEALNNYVTTKNSVEFFLANYVEYTGEAKDKLPATDFYTSYKYTVERLGMKPREFLSFAKTAAQRYATSQTRIDGRRGFQGLKIKELECNF